MMHHNPDMVTASDWLKQISQSEALSRLGDPAPIWKIVFD